MYDILEWISKYKDKPLTLPAILVFLLLILDKFGRNLVNSQVKRLFHVDDKSELKQYISNQQRIEQKIDLMMDRMGVQSCVNSSIPITTYSAEKSKTPFISRWVGFITAHVAEGFTNYISRRKNMKQVNLVTLIVCVLGAVKMVLQAYGYDLIDESQINEIANRIAAIVTVVGVILSHRKTKKEATINELTELSYSPGDNK